MSTTTSGEPTGEFALHTSWHAERYAGEVSGGAHERQGGSFTARDAGGWA